MSFLVRFLKRCSRCHWRTHCCEVTTRDGRTLKLCASCWGRGGGPSARSLERIIAKRLQWERTHGVNAPLAAQGMSLPIAGPPLGEQRCLVHKDVATLLGSLVIPQKYCFKCGRKSPQHHVGASVAPPSDIANWNDTLRVFKEFVLPIKLPACASCAKREGGSGPMLSMKFLSHRPVRSGQDVLYYFLHFDKPDGGGDADRFWRAFWTANWEFGV